MGDGVIAVGAVLCGFVAVGSVAWSAAVVIADVRGGFSWREAIAREWRKTWSPVPGSGRQP